MEWLGLILEHFDTCFSDALRGVVGLICNGNTGRRARRRRASFAYDGSVHANAVIDVRNWRLVGYRFSDWQLYRRKQHTSSEAVLRLNHKVCSYHDRRT